MDQDNQQIIVATDADDAFDQLRSEVSLLRRAIEGLTAERQAMPDYSPTLTAIADRMKQFADWVGRVAATPLLSLTPEKLEQEIARAANAARDTDRATIERANVTMKAAIVEVARVTESAWTAEDQWRALCLTGGISFLMSMILTLALVQINSRANDTPRPQVAQAQAAPAAPASQPAMSPPPRHRRHHAAVTVQ